MARIQVPQHRRCGAPEVHHRLLEDREYQARRIQIEQHAARFALFGAQRRAGIVTVPTVVHVVYNASDENISDAQVESQIDVLNRDYSAANPDRANVPAPWTGLVGNPNIRFSLASKDPQGNASSGITRTQTSETSFSTDEGVKSSRSGGADPWPSDKFLNIWVCNLGGGLLGYAQFPGGPPATDGVVILNVAFGTTGTATAPYNLGRTTTHEVGHWLNLFHIWGDRLDCSGDDLRREVLFSVSVPHVCGRFRFSDHPISRSRAITRFLAFRQFWQFFRVRISSTNFSQLDHLQRTLRPVIDPAHDPIASIQRMHVQQKISALIFQLQFYRLALVRPHFPHCFHVRETLFGPE